MSLQLVVSNPPKSTKRSKRGRKVRRRRSRTIRRNPGGVSMAKKKSRRRRRSGGGSFPFMRRTRRVSRRRGGRALAGFVSRDLLVSAAGAAAGYVGTNFVLGKLPDNWRDSDGKRIAAKIGIALVGSVVLRKAGMGALSKGLAVGGLVAAGIDAAKMANVPGVSGLGEFGISDVPSFEFGQLPASSVPGLGCFLPSSAAAVR